MKLKIFLLGITLLTLSFTFTHKESVSTNDDNLQQKIKFIASNWSSLYSNADLSYEHIDSWLPEVGIRGKYAAMKTNLSKAILEGIVQEKAFVSGPHGNGITFRSLNEFGHYNPKFLTKLQAQLTPLLNNKAFVNNVQAYYDEQLKQYLRIYFLSYKEAANNQEIIDGYLFAIDNEASSDASSGRVFLSNPSSFLQESFRGFSNAITTQGYDEYEAFTCPGFWVRRSIDGTADEFYELLLMTMKVFDAEFMSVHVPAVQDTAPTAEAGSLQQKINFIAANWSNLYAKADLTYENITSWFPESGIRGRYEVMKAQLGKSILESMLDEKVFLNDLHQNGLNFDSNHDFGRYNPQFLTKLTAKITPLLNNQDFVRSVQPFYDEQFKQYLRAYYFSYELAAHNQEVIDEYVKIIKNNADPRLSQAHRSSAFLYRSFSDFEQQVAQKVSSDEFGTYTCPGFWVRRSIDGTADQFFNLLVMVMNTFDPKRENNTYNYEHSGCGH